MITVMSERDEEINVGRKATTTKHREITSRHLSDMWD
jgi:hypothetical protein